MKCSVVVNDITRLINLIKDVFPQQVDVEYVGKNGKCYQVALVLKHVYTLIDGHYYDIEGIHFSVPPDTCLLEHNRGHKPHRWHKGFVNVPILEWLRKP
ncbi:hypothetical protein HYQ27_gp033 [Salmonella phage Se-J]|uniref:hypothetical protein n=1 Tax=Salmonella phage Se-J TaxID=2698910 RepID=UPI0018AFCFA2|nr:hypothetical protein HYQ27_gp033 [Salmonella phage Se-J]